MPSPARIIETLIALGKGKQTDIATANPVASVWALRKLNASLMSAKFNREDDAQEYGKGHEWATDTYAVSWDVSGTLEKYLSAEFAAWVMAFSLGKVVKSGTGANFTYTCTPLNPNAGDPTELPYFSFIEQIRTTASVIDRMAVGNALESWNLAFASGPGRVSSKLTAQFSGSGKLTEPSGIVIPAVTPEKWLPSASLLFSANSVDYVTSKNIVSGSVDFKNNLDVAGGFYPGSGFQTTGDATSGAIRGRLEYGDRAVGLSFVARFLNGSTEWTALKSGAKFTDASLTLQYDVNNSLILSWPQMTYKAAEIGNTNGRVTVEVTAEPLYNAGIMTAVVKCGVDGICQ